jgi:hypothetical protein
MAFTIRVNDARAERWRTAARYLGYPSVSAWLYALAQEKVKELGNELPEEVLVWKKGTLRVEMRGSTPERQGIHQIPGLMAGPFGIYRGTSWSHGEAWDDCFTLALLPSAYAYVMLKRLRDCKELARRLYRLRVRWHEADQAKINGPDELEAGEIVVRFRKDFGV